MREAGRGCELQHDACGGRGVYILVTLRRFDSFPWVEAYSGPFIPCERRLADPEIWEIQGRDFTLSF